MTIGYFLPLRFSDTKLGFFLVESVIFNRILSSKSLFLFKIEAEIKALFCFSAHGLD